MTTTTKATVKISAPSPDAPIVIGAKNAPPSAAMPTPSMTSGHVGLQPDPERGGHVRPLDAGADHAANDVVCSSSQTEQDRGDDGEDQQR